MAGPILDRGVKGLYVPRKLVVAGGFDPTKSIYAFEDFIADHIAEDSTVQVNQSGTPLTAAVISAAAGGPTAGHGGWIQGKTDDVDAEIDEVALGAKPWLVPAALAAGQVAVGEIGFVVPTALTARQYFFGLTDDETEGTGTNGSLNIDGTTNVVAVAADAAGFIMSSLATDADGYYLANVIATTAIADGVNSGLTAVVDDYTKLRVEVDVSGNAFFYGIVSGAGQREVTPVYVGVLPAAVTAASPLIPLFSAAPTTTTGVEWEIDYLYGGVSN